MELLQKLRQMQAEIPEEMKRELNELWTQHECDQFRIMLGEMELAMKMQHHPEADPPYQERIYIEEFIEHWKVLSLLEATKKREYEIYKKYGRA